MYAEFERDGFMDDTTQPTEPVNLSLDTGRDRLRLYKGDGGVKAERLTASDQGWGLYCGGRNDDDLTIALA
jgi:hypothetical protein